MTVQFSQSDLDRILERWDETDKETQRKMVVRVMWKMMRAEQALKEIARLDREMWVMEEEKSLLRIVKDIAEKALEDTE